MKTIHLPLVSIAILSYNQIKYLKECLESCLEQDYPNIEIVVSDNGSTDGTKEMLLDYDADYPGKFILKFSKKNRGITNSSNVANFSCNGKYIAWMYGDDLLLPGKISKQVKYMEERPECSICYHNLEVFDSDTGKVLSYFNENIKLDGDIKTAIRYGTFNGACSNMVRKDKTPENGFNILIPVASDWLYWIETLASGGTINYIDEVLGRYRRHVGNVTAISTEIRQNEVDHLLTCQLLLALYPHYSSDIFFRYSQLIFMLRGKLKYSDAVLLSIIKKPSMKSFFRLFLHYISLKKLRI
jgi:glycosyltransferase involved in cell wall biosynthesis